MCRGTPEDKREKVHFMVNRDNIDNSFLKSSTKSLNIFKSKTILLGRGGIDRMWKLRHAMPHLKSFSGSSYRAVYDLALAYLSKFYVLLVFLLPFNTLAMVDISTLTQVAISFDSLLLWFKCWTLILQISNTGWIWFASHYSIRINNIGINYIYI